jgi:hypothetical protein
LGTSLVKAVPFAKVHHHDQTALAHKNGVKQAEA